MTNYNDEAYKKARRNARFGHEFKAGVDFAEQYFDQQNADLKERVKELEESLLEIAKQLPTK